jgi:mannose-1-phosphate guanylyltransferase/mannose-6-phosphate isomerase
MEICPVILCGGSGTRLWPASRPDFPKQFIPLIGDLSSFQHAVLRLHNATGVTIPIVVAGAAHESLVKAQLEAIGVSCEIVIEPQGRDSCPAVAAAVYFRSKRAPDTIFVVQPADHHIPDVSEYRKLIATAARGAEAGKIVTLAIVPTEPSPSFGYIGPGEPIAGASGVMTVRQFIEKPTRERARSHIEQGYLWNAGIFIFRGTTFAEELERFQPGMADGVKLAVARGEHEDGTIHLDPVAFANTPKNSIDYAIMEHTTRAATVRAGIAWSDLGAWSAVHSANTKSEDDNVASGERIALVNTRGSIVHAPHATVAVVGLDGVGVIVEQDAVLVCSLDESHSVKTAVDILKSANRPAVLRRTGPRRAAPSLLQLSAEFDSWLDASALPLWWSLGADHREGGFFGALDEHGRSVAMQKRFRVQARQTFVFAAAGAAGWTGPWRDAVSHGLRFMFERHRRSDGLFRGAANEADGTADDAMTLYDQAFALLAFASVERALPGQTEARALAEHVLRTLLKDHKHPVGGFVEAEMHGTRLQSNPHMHLLEASLAWLSLGGNCEDWRHLADGIVELCSEYFIDPGLGAVREFFADDGSPAEGPPGKLLEPGHQFEWCWLLTQAAHLLDNGDARETALRLYRVGAEYGVDVSRGVAMDELSDDLSVRSARARLWPQTERLKAALGLAKLAAGDGRMNFERDAAAAAEGFHHYLDMDVKGLWRDKMRPDGTFVIEPSPATSLYHIAGAILELRNHVRRTR